MARKNRADQPTPHRFRLESLEVEGYKSLDKLTLQLPLPRTSDQADVFVLGSRNGVGKSSVLECCALVVLSGISPRFFDSDPRESGMLNPYDVLIRAGMENATLAARLHAGGASHNLKLEIHSHELKNYFKLAFEKHTDPPWLPSDPLERGTLLGPLLGWGHEPLIVPPVLLFHSYRKVQEGNSTLDAMVEPMLRRRAYPGRWFGGRSPFSTFKLLLVQTLMGSSGLFEGISSRRDNEAVLEKLNELIQEFAGGVVDKLRPGSEGTLELRVRPSQGGASFSFDGLSSGQKEIISTLFLIWYTTQQSPSIVLIDEPELHLNAEWQRIFVRKIADFSPDNQYILATHSEEIFGSVPEDRRLLLRSE